jgi:hypothetical protein
VRRFHLHNLVTKRWRKRRADRRAEAPKYRAAAAFYNKRWRTNWDVLGALVEAAAKYEDAASLRLEYVILTDIYHSLGACRTACAMAWSISTLVVITYVVAGAGSAVTGLITIGLTGVAGLGLWLLLNQTRRQTWKAAQKLLQMGFRRLMVRHPDFLFAGPVTEPRQLALLDGAR